MNDFTFYNPTHFVFGRNAELQIGEKAIEMGYSRILLVYGQGSVLRSGLLERVKESLISSNIAFFELGGIVPNPQDGPVYEGVRMVRENALDCVLGVGGASALDTAKAIAVGALYDGDFWDFYAGKQKVSRALPIISIPTIAAAGSESSSSSVITKTSIPLKRGINAELIRPMLALMNPTLTFTVPAIQKAYGVADMMAHIFERYFTNTKDVLLTDEMCEGVLRAIIKAGPKALFSPGDYASHADIMWAGALAHNNTLSTGREQDWSCHAMGHGISARFDAPHGAVLAVLFPFWMQCQLEHDLERFRRFAVQVMQVQEGPDAKTVAENGIQRLRTFFDSLGLPHNLKTFGVQESDIDQLVNDVGYRPDGKIGFFRPLASEDVRAIYRLALG
ncbi:MAG: iron-containing alcohol dehydrogenase [Eubacteriales bacterium]|jgi:alcohol dehydrogenase YqhD (iron-dependent ADH family)|nr:iron-containing alcohol dehydrogenase [Eubacteriales bacterium]MDD4105956.1 iron-containing alcohol dehydrogenase [Eubacteriales bacterium]MDD4711224.1 iron-containing alcohol dehydrogenase [Eubacteriales bacterium]NLO15678.1 iron-containing alcohol dehydrogenase [Clostridiales bacterium]